MAKTGKSTPTDSNICPGTAYNRTHHEGGHMKARWGVLLVIAMMLVIQSCGNDGPNPLNRSNDWLVKFKRVTLATDAPDRLEIEIVVCTGQDFTLPAPDGTKVVVETSISEFEGNGPVAVSSTVSGRAIFRLILQPGVSHTVVVTRVDEAAARLSIVVDEKGSLRIVS